MSSRHSQQMSTVPGGKFLSHFGMPLNSPYNWNFENLIYFHNPEILKSSAVFYLSNSILRYSWKPGKNAMIFAVHILCRSMCEWSSLYVEPGLLDLPRQIFQGTGIADGFENWPEWKSLGSVILWWEFRPLIGKWRSFPSLLIPNRSRVLGL